MELTQTRKINNIDDRKIDNIKLKNLIQPIFVKKSNRYRGIPPRTNTNKAIKSMNFIPMLKTALFKYFIENTIKNELCRSVDKVTTYEYT